jgi:hypothetical protein
MVDGMLECGLIAPDGEPWWYLDVAVTAPLLCAMARCVLCVIDIQVPQEMVDDGLVNGVHALAPCPSYQTQNWDGSIPLTKYIGQILPSQNHPQSKHIPKRLRSFWPSISGLMFG